MVVYDDNSGAAGTELWRLTSALNVSGGATLIFNGIRQIATLSSADVTSTYLPPASGYFRLLDGIADGQVWVACTSGTAVLDYRKRWR